MNLYKLAQLELPKESRETPKELMRRRRYFVKRGYIEYEGCENDWYGEGYLFTTMSWRKLPLQKCKNHPRYWLRVALVAKTDVFNPVAYRERSK